MPLERVISGGQTGVDRAALDAARDCGLALGGWCPRGRKSEGGPIPDEYPLVETPSARYSVRTRANVEQADATLVVTRGEPTGGTALTVALADRLERQLLAVDLDSADPALVLAWLQEFEVRTLNVAGPRESQQPGIHAAAREFLRPIFRAAGRCRRTT